MGVPWPSPARARPNRPTRPQRRTRPNGQGMVEFALVLPVFLLVLMAVIEFSFAFNAFLSVSFASRNATVIATETCGDGTCGHLREFPFSDCQILMSIERDMMAPASAQQIGQVEIMWTDANGVIKGNGSAITTWARTGSTACNDDGLRVPYTRTSNQYPHDERCSIVNGCPTLDGVGSDTHATIDTIGVRITYQYNWHTPYAAVFQLLPGAVDIPPAGGWQITRSAEMRMEPTL